MKGIKDAAALQRRFRVRPLFSKEKDALEYRLFFNNLIRFFDDVNIERQALSEWTLESALKLALNIEEESIRLYTSAQGKVLNSSSVEFLKHLAKEEEKHKNKILEAMRYLEKVEEIGHFETKIQDLKVVDYLEDVSLSPEADY